MTAFALVARTSSSFKMLCLVQTFSETKQFNSETSFGVSPHKDQFIELRANATENSLLIGTLDQTDGYQEIDVRDHNTIFFEFAAVHTC